MKQIMACMPVDRSRLPQIPEVDDIVITDLYTLKQCKIDGCGDVWVGPRQLAAYKENSDDFVIMCFIHALTATLAVNGSFDPTEDVRHLGGGYPAEGRARI